MSENRIKKAVALATALKKKSSNMAHGGKCYACGGIVSKEMSEGGSVDDYNPESIMDADGDNDALQYSPELPESTAWEGSEPEEEMGAETDDDDKRANFLRAYLVQRKVRSQG